MADRSLWYEAHLFADRAGRRAREACEQLGPQAHEIILARGDRVAAVSSSVAQQFYKHAAAVWEALGAAGFERWVGLGHDLLTAEPWHRDAALAFFTVSSK